MPGQQLALHVNFRSDPGVISISEETGWGVTLVGDTGSDPQGFALNPAESATTPNNGQFYLQGQAVTERDRSGLFDLGGLDDSEELVYTVPEDGIYKVNGMMVVYYLGKEGYGDSNNWFSFMVAVNGEWDDKNGEAAGSDENNGAWSTERDLKPNYDTFAAGSHFSLKKGTCCATPTTRTYKRTSDIDLLSASFLVNSRTLMGCSDSTGGRRAPSAPSRFSSKLPHLC